MNQLKNCITTQVSIDEVSLVSILDCFEEVTLKKGEYFLKSGTLCRKMAFVDSGYLRMFDIADGKEVTLWIASAGRFVTSLSSFVFQSDNYWNIQAVTDCKLYVISRDRHAQLCKSQPKWLEFDNLLLAHSFALLEQSMFSQLHTTARQRFEMLLEEEPLLFNHVPLQHIASMLGIAPESLSRLRKNRMKNIT